MSSNTHTLPDMFSQLVADVPAVSLHDTLSPIRPHSQSILDDLDEPGAIAQDDDVEDSFEDGTDAEPLRTTTKRKATRDAPDLPDPDDDDLVPRTPSQAKKEHHNTHTRRCRERLNRRFESLYDMLPSPAGNDVKHKVQILDHAIAMFSSLRQENSELELSTAMRSPAHTRRWIHGFAMNAPDVVNALIPLLNLFCTRKKWMYAEIWSLKNGPDQTDSQTMSVDYFTNIENPVLLKRSLTRLGTYMKQEFICQTCEDFVGKVFDQYQPQWSTSIATGCRDVTRTHLLQECGVRTCLVVPVSINGSVMHAVSFYDFHERPYDRALVQFALFAATTIGNCYGAAQEKQQIEMSKAIQTPRPTPKTLKVKAS